MKIWHRFWMRWHLWRQEFEAAAHHWRKLGKPRPMKDWEKRATDEYFNARFR